MVMVRTPAEPDTTAVAETGEADFLARGGIDPQVREPAAEAGDPEPVATATADDEYVPDGTPIQFAVVHGFPGRRTRKRPWLGRVHQLQYGLMRATLFDGTHRTWCFGAWDLVRKCPPGTPYEAAVWAEAVLRNFQRDPKCWPLYGMEEALKTLLDEAREFLADHHPPCRCGVCDMLAARDLRDPATKPGTALVRHVRRLYADLAAVLASLRECNSYPQDETPENS